MSHLPVAPFPFHVRSARDKIDLFGDTRVAAIRPDYPVPSIFTARPQVEIELREIRHGAVILPGLTGNPAVAVRLSLLVVPP